MRRASYLVAAGMRIGSHKERSLGDSQCSVQSSGQSSIRSFILAMSHSSAPNGFQRTSEELHESMMRPLNWSTFRPKRAH